MLNCLSLVFVLLSVVRHGGHVVDAWVMHLVRKEGSTVAPVGGSCLSKAPTSELAPCLLSSILGLRNEFFWLSFNDHRRAFRFTTFSVEGENIIGKFHAMFLSSCEDVWLTLSLAAIELKKPDYSRRRRDESIQSSLRWRG